MLTTLFLAATMSQATQSPMWFHFNATFRPGPIANVPAELIAEIFRLVVLSLEKDRSRAANTLRLVDKRWNGIAFATSELWTKVTLAYPFCLDRLSGTQRQLEASAQKAIDINIDLRDPAWMEFADEDHHPLTDPGMLHSMVEVLRGSEHRWRSLCIRSDILYPIYEFLQQWTAPDFPLLESISFGLCNGNFSRYTGPTFWQDTKLQILFGSDWIPMPRLRELSFSAVSVDWTPAVASFQNLRKLEIKYQLDKGPTYMEFASLVAASPGIEVLDLTGYCPHAHVMSNLTGIPLVRLPALKHFTFGGLPATDVLGFLTWLQISETLETFTLIGPGPDNQGERPSQSNSEDTSKVFNTLASLNPEDLDDKDPSSSWISMLGLKKLSVIQAEPLPQCFAAFLDGFPVVEEICLIDVGREGLLSLLSRMESRIFPFLKKVYIKQTPNCGYGLETPAEVRVYADGLRELEVQVELVVHLRGHRYIHLN